MPDQLELFPESPFAVRLRFADALQIFWDTYWCHLPSAVSTKKNRDRLRSFFANRFVDEISKADVENLRRHLAALGLKANTVNKSHTILTRLFNKLNEWRDARIHAGIDFTKIPLPSKNPGAQVPKVDERQFARRVAWPRRLVYRLIEAAVALGDVDFAETIEMLYMTKLRPGDLWAMTENNVNLPRLVLHGIQHKTITTSLPSGVPYLIRINNRMADILRRRLQCTLAGASLFVDRNTQKRWAAIRHFANAKKVQLRDFRPSAATLLLDNGIDPETVRELLGQTTLRQLPAYTRRSMVHQVRAQSLLEDEEVEILM